MDRIGLTTYTPGEPRCGMPGFAGAFLFTLLVAGCGGDNASPTAPSPTTPSASQRPVVTDLVFNNRPQSGDIYSGGEEISVGIRFSKQVSITGSPQLALTIGTTTRQATTFQHSTLTNFLYFEHSVQQGDRDEDGISIAANALSLNGGTIRSAEGEDAVLDLGTHAIRNDPAHKVDGSSQRPTVTGVGFNNRPQSGDTYRANERISVYISFSKQVIVAGSVRLALTIGTTTRQAEPRQGSTPAHQWSFYYTVRPNDRDEDGIGIAANALSLDGGTIRSSDGEDAILDFGAHAVSNDPDRKVGGSDPPSNRPAWFDEQYWNALVYYQLDSPGPLEGRWSRVHSLAAGRAVNFHIRTTVAQGPPLDPSIVDRWRRAIPGLMRQFVGAPWSGRITEGTEAVERPGWISIEIPDDSDCASAQYSPLVDGGIRGVIRLNTTQGDWCLATVLLAHELGHVLGFYHVDDSDDIMCTDVIVTGGDCNGRIWETARFDPTFTPRLARHAQLAYQIGRAQYPGVPQSWISSGGR